jgi:hypothetical protein
MAFQKGHASFHKSLLYILHAHGLHSNDARGFERFRNLNHSTRRLRLRGNENNFLKIIQMIPVWNREEITREIDF